MYDRNRAKAVSDASFPPRLGGPDVGHVAAGLARIEGFRCYVCLRGPRFAGKQASARVDRFVRGLALDPPQVGD